jgi:hypothetical protein
MQTAAPALLPERQHISDATEQMAALMKLIAPCWLSAISVSIVNLLVLLAYSLSHEDCQAILLFLLLPTLAAPPQVLSILAMKRKFSILINDLADVFGQTIEVFHILLGALF